MTINTALLKNKKNLLAFSAGVDSTALFFILLQHNIPFDIAIVDYNLREQSKLEIAYAKELAKQYDKKCYTKEVKLTASNFEKKARESRYLFFEELIYTHAYENLLTAHQLNDKLEWFLMQLSKGAGLVELIGLNTSEKRENYTLIRPIIHYAKKELLHYLNQNKYKYFTDESNFDDKYKRNYFRKKFSNVFLDEFEKGVKRSFDYLEHDISSLELALHPLYSKCELEIFRNQEDNNKNIRTIDKSLKIRGFILSKKQRDEILKQKEIVVSHKIVICIGENYIWIAPFSTSFMNKKFKESCRINNIPNKIRPYLQEMKIDINVIIKKLMF